MAEESKGVGGAGGMAQAGVPPQAAPMAGGMAEADALSQKVTELRAQITREAEEKFEKDAALLRSTKDREIAERDRRLQAMETRLQALTASLEDTARESLGEDSVTKMRQKYAPAFQPVADPTAERYLKAGVIFAEGTAMGLTMPDMQSLVNDPAIGPADWKSHAREILTRRELRTMQDEYKRELDQARKDREEFMKQLKETREQAVEKERQVRKEVGADQIPSGAGPTSAPDTDLERRYKEDLAKLAGSGDMKAFMDLKAKYRQEGLKI